MKWLLCLYPPAWRERYEEEMLALLEQHRTTWCTVLSLLRGALDARFDPYFITRLNMTAAEATLRLRRAHSTILWTFPALILGYMCFLDGLDDAFYAWNQAHAFIRLFKAGSEILLVLGLVSFLLTSPLSLAISLLRREVSRKLLRVALAPLMLTFGAMVLHLLYTVVWGGAIWHTSASTVQHMALAVHRSVWPGDGWHLHLIAAYLWMGMLTGHTFQRLRQGLSALKPAPEEFAAETA